MFLLLHTLTFENAIKQLLLVGDSCVGKTSLLIRFKDRIFLRGSYISTVGIDYKTKVVNANEQSIRLQIWDTAGQEKYRSLTKSYYRDSDAVVLVYDIGRMETLVHTKSWMSEINANILSKTLLVLTGNKADDEAERVVARKDGERLAKDAGAMFWETSAKTGLNVDNLFQSIADQLTSKKQSTSNGDPNHKSATARLSTDKKSSSQEEASSGCCSWL